ncbi:MAG: hypothetical protein KJ879_01910 [Nanoarchaeota archaeon]|nr:hypothetical protein [Nanoarchaeota archaeon]
MDFLWHKVSEKEKEEIRKEAERIMSGFSKKLEKVKGNVKDLGSRTPTGPENFERAENSEESCEIDRDIMFSNAPNKNKDSIVAEKGDW